MIGLLIKGAFDIATGWVTSRIEKSKVRTEAAVEIEKAKAKAAISQAARSADAEIEWDNTMAEGSLTSWKDEFWTVVLATPLVLSFIPIPAIQEAIKTGFLNIDKLPDWYVIAVGLAIGAAFGYRKIVELVRKR
ncbi:hypothetical protein [Pyruvatibacter mobilis]|uniref:hypothetical protein n=1 Tax=Pyruvatibacter mobilis TaxID=1712261 RepID=UPI003BAA9E37